MNPTKRTAKQFVLFIYICMGNAGAEEGGRKL